MNSGRIDRHVIGKLTTGKGGTCHRNKIAFPMSRRLGDSNAKVRTCYFTDADLSDITDSRLHGTTAQFDMLGMLLDGRQVASTIDDCH